MRKILIANLFVFGLIACLLLVEKTSSISYAEESSLLSIDPTMDLDSSFKEDVVVSIGATNMNVFYIGVPNPVSIAASHYPTRGLHVSITNGTIRKVGKQYEVIVSRPGKATIQVSFLEKNGRAHLLGSQEFRIRRLPKPQAQFGVLKPGGTYPKEAFLAQMKMVASLGQGFAFSGVKFKISSFNFIFSPTNPNSTQKTTLIKSEKSGISEEMKALITNAEKGDRIILDRIMATGPTSNCSLLPVIYTIN